jgi:murein DD-endopeptidase MepM/ murein hydrolase activator NlpD
MRPFFCPLHIPSSKEFALLSRHSSAPDAPASDAGDPTLHVKPLTRRELRERERLARSPLEIAEAADAARLEAELAATSSARESVAEDQVVDTVELRDADEHDETVGLTAAADELIAAELTEPDLEPAFFTESNRSIAAPAASEAPATDDLLTEELFTGSIRSTEVPLPTRAQLRTEARAGARSDSRTTRAYRPHTTLNAPRPAQPRRPGRVRGIATKGATVAAMAFVALMAVSTSLPAEALLSSADVQTAAHDAMHSHTAEPAQSLDIIGGTDTITVQRDGYESKSIAEVAAASGIRLEATFTNNPNGTVQWPFAVGVHIGDHFGYRNCAGCSVNHGGQDFNPGIGAPIQSIADGVVAYTQDGEGSLGVHMIIEHVINGKKVASVYAHMIHGSMLLSAGDPVKAGQVIGKTGNTGMSTGPHLHFEIRLGGKDGTKTDPLEWLYANVN